MLLRRECYKINRLQESPGVRDEMLQQTIIISVLGGQSPSRIDLYLIMLLSYFLLTVKLMFIWVINWGLKVTVKLVTG